MQDNLTEIAEQLKLVKTKRDELLSRKLDYESDNTANLSKDEYDNISEEIENLNKMIGELEYNKNQLETKDSSQEVNQEEIKLNKESQEESSKNIKQPLSTKGKGDCAFHAALGIWNPLTNQFETTDVQKKRNTLAERIRNCEQDSDIFPLIKQAINELAMGGVNIKGEIYSHLRKAYNYYERQDNDEIKNKWTEFEEELQKHPLILVHINQFIEEYVAIKALDESNLIHLQNLREKFSTCENEGDEILRALIMSIPELEQAYLRYKKPNEEVDLEQWFNDENLLIEYADYISRPGQWLLPCELNIIAYVFDISIEYYPEKNARPEYFNPGKERTVPICFNGRDHYERMASEQEIAQFKKESSSEHVDYLDHPVDIPDDTLDSKEILEAISRTGYLTKIQITNNHKNLHRGFSWPDQSDVCELSMLSVITGKNGIGKSVLLEAILMGFENRLARQQFPVELSFNEDLHENEIPDIFSFSSSNGNGGVIRNTAEESAKKHQSDIDDTFNDLKKHDLSRRYGRSYELKYPGLESTYNKVITAFENKNDLAIDMINNDYQAYFYINLRKELEEYIGVHISTYGSLEKLPKYLLEDRKINLQGLNQFLENKKFKYVISEKSLKSQGQEQFKFDRLILQEKNSADTVDHGWLSPGERLQLLILLWIYASRVINSSDVGAVFILDEFDAHLHPSLTKEVIEVIKSKLVFEYQVQVIMTTHSPTTVSLVPHDSLYIMSDDNSDKTVVIRKAKSKQQAIRLLTSDFVYVNEPFIVVFVEGDKDKLFYSTIVKRMADAGIIHMQVNFKVHGTGKNDALSSCSAVQLLIEKMTQAELKEPLAEFVFGLIDGDNKKAPKLANLKALKRYSVENYIFDPVNLFICLYFIKQRSKHDSDYLEKLENCVNYFKLLLTQLNLVEKTLTDILTEKNLRLIINKISTMLMNKFKQALFHRENNYKVLITLIDDQIFCCSRIDKKSFDNLYINNLRNVINNIVIRPSKLRKHFNQFLLELQRILELKIEETNHDLFNLTSILTIDENNSLFSDLNKIMDKRLNQEEKIKEISNLIKCFFVQLIIVAQKKQTKDWEELKDALANRYIKIMDEDNKILSKDKEEQRVCLIVKNQSFEFTLSYYTFLLYFRGHNLQVCYEKIFKIPHQLAHDFPNILDQEQIVLLPHDLKIIFTNFREILSKNTDKFNSKISNTGKIRFFEEIKTTKKKEEEKIKSEAHNKERIEAQNNLSDGVLEEGLGIFSLEY